MATDAIEGFLCPTCVKDFGSVDQLTSHVQLVHGSFEKSQKLPIKDLIEKAYQKLLKTDGNFQNSDFSIAQSNRFLNTSTLSDCTIQEIGTISVCTKEFIQERNSKVDTIAVDTNKLLIRLDKLLTDMPSDLLKRKALEKTLIPWLKDSEAQFCKVCGAKFSLTKRKHHCRLCGRILCSNCSQFLHFSKARKMINPAYAIVYHNEAEEVKKLKESKKSDGLLKGGDLIRRVSSAASSNLSFRKAEILLNSSLSKLKLDGSEVSVNSFYAQDGEEHLRICPICHDLLEKRDKQVDQRSTTPLLMQMYNRLKLLIDECERLFESYAQMCESLNNGETKYDLNGASSLKLRIENLLQQIGYMSEKFAPDDSSSDCCTVREMTLIKNIQFFTVEFLKSVIYTMPKLPDADRYAELRAAFRSQLETAAKNEQLAFASTKLKGTISVDSFSVLTRERSASRNVSTIADGWIPLKFNLHNSISAFSLTPVEHSDESSYKLQPFLEQIALIKEFIQQATADGRLEEVDILTSNLKELELALNIKRKEILEKLDESNTKDNST